jgi:hypothetical protein
MEKRISQGKGCPSTACSCSSQMKVDVRRAMVQVDTFSWTFSYMSKISFKNIDFLSRRFSFGRFSFKEIFLLTTFFFRENFLLRRFPFEKIFFQEHCFRDYFSFKVISSFEKISLFEKIFFSRRFSLEKICLWEAIPLKIFFWKYFLSIIFFFWEDFLLRRFPFEKISF